MALFEKFGEFDSAEEINRAVAAQLAEGDTEAIIAIAKENGIDTEDVQDYIDGYIKVLVNPLQAAMGKLSVEEKDLQLEGLTEAWKTYVLQLCTEDEAVCKAVRKKGKSLEKCFGKLLKLSFGIKKKLDDRIVKAAGLKPPIYTGIPTEQETKQLIKEYYLGK